MLPPKRMMAPDRKVLAPVRGALPPFLEKGVMLVVLAFFSSLFTVAEVIEY